MPWSITYKVTKKCVCLHVQALYVYYEYEFWSPSISLQLHTCQASTWAPSYSHNWNILNYCNKNCKRLHMYIFLQNWEGWWTSSCWRSVRWYLSTPRQSTQMLFLSILSPSAMVISKMNPWSSPASYIYPWRICRIVDCFLTTPPSLGSTFTNMLESLGRRDPGVTTCSTLSVSQIP